MLYNNKNFQSANLNDLIGLNLIKKVACKADVNAPDQ